jgi:hypothetical protein
MDAKIPQLNEFLFLVELVCSESFFGVLVASNLFVRPRHPMALDDQNQKFAHPSIARKIVDLSLRL